MSTRWTVNLHRTFTFHIKGGETHFKLWFPCNPSWSQNFSLWLILLPRLSTGISLQGITQATARYSVVAIFCFKFYSTLEESSLFSLLLGFGPRKYLHNLTRCALLHSSTQSGIEIHSKLNEFLQIDGISTNWLNSSRLACVIVIFFLNSFQGLWRVISWATFLTPMFLITFLLPSTYPMLSS